MARHRRTRQIKKALALLLAIPLIGWGAYRSLPVLTDLAARAALVSAYVNMPEGSVALLEERFNSELFENGEKDDPIVSQAPPAVSSAPEVPSSPGADLSSAPDENAPRDEDRIDLPGPDSVPPRFRGTIREVQYGADGTPLYIPLAAGYLKNSTNLENDEVQAELDQPLELKLEETTEPQVLILHTHATEAYEPYPVDFYDTRGTWRSTDNSCNMVQVGNRIAEQLEAAGIGVIHDGTQHDYPSYNGAYERSAETVKAWLEEYPSIKVVLDVHRDAIQPEDDVIVKATAEIEGKKAAQVMIITGCEDGTMGVPDWPSNLRFAAALQSTAEGMYPGLMRPIFFCYRKYNMDLTKGSILLEFGSHGNTLEEAEYSGELIGKALAEALKGTLPEGAATLAPQSGAGETYTTADSPWTPGESPVP